MPNLTDQNQMKRQRMTKEEIETLDAFLLAYAERYQPVTVRQLYYAASVRNIAKVGKDESGYHRVQRRVQQLRWAGQMPWFYVTDNSRTVWAVRTYHGVNHAASSWSSNYCLNYWAESDECVEVWLEKDALAGSIAPVTEEFRVKLMPSRGFGSDGFIEAAVREAVTQGKKRMVIYTLYDFDRSGQDAKRTTHEKMERLVKQAGSNLEIVHQPLALNYVQASSLVEAHRPPKRQTVADQKWPYDFAVELDALPPDTLRQKVRDALLQHISVDRLRELQMLEEQQKAQIRMALKNL